MSDLRDELYSLLVPLAGERLIVPRACVAEVIGYQAPAEMTNAPPWYAGLVSWNGVLIRGTGIAASPLSPSWTFHHSDALVIGQNSEAVTPNMLHNRNTRCGNSLCPWEWSVQTLLRMALG